MADRFTAPVLHVLRESGWFEGRQADTTAAKGVLHEWGIAVQRAAAGILQEFTGLDCYAKETDSWLRFDVREALKWSMPWQGPAFGWIIGQPLCPVAHGNGCMLLAAESGEVVWLKDDWLGYIREESFPYALDTHFRADYGRTTWVDLDEGEVGRLFARLKDNG